MSQVYDLAIVGSGFAGSLLAQVARKLGRSVILLERHRHPRFAIGESSTPLANLLLEEIATRYDLPRLLPLTKWGSWQATYPDLAVGLKRGFSFYHHRVGQPWRAAEDRSDQLLVAASPHDGIADTHWFRADFDQFFMQEAVTSGADYVDEVALTDATWDGETATLSGTRAGEAVTYRARFVVDATGPRGFLHRALGLPEASVEAMPPTQALFSHFTGVGLMADQLPGGDTPPYPVDDAALHHVFDGGWMWVLRFNNGITSAGFAVREDLARDLKLSEGAPAWNRLMQRLPTVQKQFADAVPVMPLQHAPRLSFRSGQIVGEWWAQLPSAAGFADPLLSTGFPLTLLGVARLARALETAWQTDGLQDHLQRYAAVTDMELRAAQQLVGALYATMPDFELFSQVARLYFAAASYAETARRLQRPELAGGFLLHDNPRFGPQTRACLDSVIAGLSSEQRTAWLEQVRQTVEPFDVAGLNRRDRANWYPVDTEDLLSVPHKVDTTRADLEALLAHAGFYA